MKLASLQKHLAGLSQGKRPQGTTISSSSYISDEKTKRYAEEFRDEFAHYQDLDGSELDLDDAPNRVMTRETVNSGFGSSHTTERRVNLHQNPDTRESAMTMTSTFRTKNGQTSGLQTNDVVEWKFSDDKVTRTLVGSTSYNEISGEVIVLHTASPENGSYQSFTSAD